jgi:carbonic anhydrase
VGSRASISGFAATFPRTYTLPLTSTSTTFGPATYLGARHCSNHANAMSDDNQRPQKAVKYSRSDRDLDSQPPQEVRKYLQQSHDRIFDNNKKWVEEMKKKRPEFFENLSAGQSPEYLWIGTSSFSSSSSRRGCRPGVVHKKPPTAMERVNGAHSSSPRLTHTTGCSDSRIPAEAITGLEPGEMFIHRNIANLVCATDLNVMSVVNYAVRHLHVKHIVVCGHYGCGGVKAAMTPKDMGLLNPWLRNIRDVYRLHEAELDNVEGDAKYDKLVEFNVLEQARNIIKTAAVQQQYAKHGYPIVHGWVFGFEDGLLKDLEIDFEGQLKSIQKIYDLTTDALEGS